jgi:hypothetical protein
LIRSSVVTLFCLSSCSTWTGCTSFIIRCFFGAGSTVTSLSFLLRSHIQNVPEGKVNIPGGLGIGHSKQKSSYARTFTFLLLRMTDTMTSQDSDLSFWDTLYKRNSLILGFWKLFKLQTFMLHLIR